MTSQRIDRILLGLGALLILISSYQLFFKPQDITSGLKLGTLTSTFSVVKTKNAMALDWRDAAIGNDLTENQLIYTDNDSSAKIAFNEGSSIEIGENSLIKLRTSGSEQGMDLSKGFIRARLENGKPLKVQMNGEDYLVSGEDADIQISIQDQKGEIGVLSGEVKVKADGIIENLNPENALAIDGVKRLKKAIYFKNSTPISGAKIYSANPTTPVTFSWTPSEEANVVISKKSSMEKSQNYPSTAELGPGQYYYKIESLKGTSLVSSFRIIEEVPPEILRPTDGETLSIMEDREPEIFVQWKSEERQSFLLEWDDGEFHSETINGSSALIRLNSLKPFKWRVRIQDKDRPSALPSEWQNITIQLVTIPQMPQELLPNEVEFQTYEAPDEKVELSWTGQDKVELEIKNPKGEVVERTILGTSSDFQATMAGEYSWRVRGVDSYLRSSDWSAWKKFTIQDLSHEKNDEGVQRIQLTRPDQSVSFSWKAEEGSESVFELSKDASFKTIIKKVQVNKDSTQVSIPEVGSYYWRSRQFLPDGTLHVSEPRKVIIEPVPAPDKPERLPDLEVPLIEKPFKTTLIQKFFNILISTAHADELKGSVRIELPAKEEAKGYIVRIYRDEKLSKLAFETKISTRNFEWNNVREGEYYWQYAVIDFWDRQSLFSDAAKLTIKGELVPPPVKPSLRSPIRSAKVKNSNLVLNWRGNKLNQNYKVELAEDSKFNKILHTEWTKETEANVSKLGLEPKHYYWRVFSFNRRGLEVKSNTGQFIIQPIQERIIIADFPKEFEKDWKRRGFIGWAPSMDSYSFSDSENGQIDGNTLMSGLISGTIFKDHYAFNGEILRQTGKVYESETYLFQRILLDGVKTWDRNSNHKLAAGLVFGQSSGQSYQVNSGKVTSKPTSGLSYGPVLRNYLSFNKDWEMQGRAMYLLGEIKQMEFGADAIRHYEKYLLLGGLSYATREYELSSGKQTSMKVTFGIGKEF